MKKLNRMITGFLGVSMFLFGVLKFINPFKGWFSEQVIKSELPFPTLSYWAGQIGEIVIGVALLYVLIKSTQSLTKNLEKIFVLAHVGIAIMMLVAIYVHVHPNVPADVLPLKIRPPFIPGFFICLSVLNLYLKPHFNQNK